MKIMQIIEQLLNCLYLAVELWEWLEKKMPIFKDLMQFSG